MASRFKHDAGFPAAFKCRQVKEAQISTGPHTKWGRMRRIHLRSSPWCIDCGAVAEEVHHVVPRSIAPDLTYNWDNLASLCRACHQKRHGKSTYANRKPHM